MFKFDTPRPTNKSPRSTGKMSTPLTDGRTLNLTEIKKLLNSIKTKYGLLGSTVEVDLLDIPYYVDSRIDTINWNIYFTISPRVIDVLDDPVVRRFLQKRGRDGVSTLLSDLMIHEIGHWELPWGSGIGCPYDLYTSYKSFIGPIMSTLKRFGILPEDLRGGNELVGYLANLLEDIIDNTNCRQFSDMDGMVLFWYLQGRIDNTDKYSRLYEAFVRLNLYLWGDREQYRLLRRFMTMDPEVDQAIKEFWKRIGLDGDPEKNRRILLDRERWSKIAEVFAEVMSRLLDSYSEMGVGSETEDWLPPSPGSDRSEDKPPEKIVVESFEKGLGIPDYFDTYEAFDIIYRELADEIEIRAEEFTEGYSLPLIPSYHRPFDPEQDDYDDINPYKLMIDDHGEVTFGVPRVRYPLVFPVKKGIKRFPGVNICIIDSSASMSEGLDGDPGSTKIFPWGDNSKYHYAILGFYGILKYLVKQNLLHVVDIGVVNFSSRTIVSDGSLEDAKRVLFSWQNEGTELNLSLLLDAMEKKIGKHIVYTISDGEVLNWGSIRDRFIDVMRRHYYFHIQLGVKSGMSEDLKRAGLQVYYVRRGRDLSNLMVDLTVKSYDDYANSHTMYDWFKDRW